MIISSGPATTTHTFVYNTNNQVVTHNILTQSTSPSQAQNAAVQYYRNAAGQIDSVRIISSVNGTVNKVQKAYFYYNSNGNVSNSYYIPNTNVSNAISDSSIYQYSGSFLIQRTDYAAGTITRTLIYQYSGTNITNIVFQNNAASDSATALQQGTILVSYNYDTSKPALSINGFQYKYVIGFAYQEYAAVNNISAINYQGDGWTAGATYTYTYLTNGKPYLATLKETNAKKQVTTSSIQFFYD